MKRMRVPATIFVLAVAALGIWLASTGVRKGGTDAGNTDAAGAAYDYVVRDVVVQQMGPDGTLQYEMSAKQITQQPENGRITATELVMHRDPPGSEPNGPNRWTLHADRADFPESGGVITLQGNVQGRGRLGKALTPVSVATGQLEYNLESQDVSIDRAVDFRRGSSEFQCDGLRMNIQRGTAELESCDGTYAP
jgi:LPS export ABC transporter protein LptC